MKETGWLLICVGVMAVIVGAAMDVTVSAAYIGASYSSPGGYLPPLPSSVANLQKMHIQALVVQGGLVAILCGTILAAAGGIVDTIREGRTPSADPAPKATNPPERATPEPASEDDPSLKWVMGGIAALFLIVVAIAIIAGSLQQSSRRSGDNVAADNATSAVQNAMDEMNAAAAEAMNAANAVEAEAYPRLR